MKKGKQIPTHKIGQTMLNFWGTYPAPKKNNEKEKPLLFDPFTDPKKEITYPLENLFPGYIKEDDEIDEITILYKKTDQNNNIVYQDLISRITYTEEELEKNNIEIPKRPTIITLISKTNWLKNALVSGYLTIEYIIRLYNSVNCDELSNTSSTAHPRFIQSVGYNDTILDKDDEVLTKLLIILTTSNKIPVLVGDSGIGKSSYINKISSFKGKESTFFKHVETWKVDYNEFKNGLLTRKQKKDRITNLFNTHYLKYAYSILVIDNFDMNDKFFLSQLKEIKEKTGQTFYIVANNETIGNDLDNNYFDVINVPKPKEEIIKSIITEVIKKQETRTKLNLALNEEEKDELKTILLNVDQTECIVNNFNNNPSLAKIIIENAFKIASAFQQQEVTLRNFIEALNLQNVNIAPDAKERTIITINDLDKKIDERKRKEKEAQEKKLSYKLKNIFRKNNKKGV